MGRDRVVVKIIGRNNYIKWTLKQWVLEVKDIVENEYGVEIDVVDVDSESSEPILAVNDIVFPEGLPGEEGYLIEVLKKAIESIRET